MEKFEPIIQRYNENKANILQEMGRAFLQGDKNGMFNIQKKIYENETNREYVDALGQIGVLEEQAKYVLKNPSVTSGELFVKMMDYASNKGHKNFQDYLEDSMPYLGNNLKPKDIQTMFEDYEKNLFEYTEGTKTVVGEETLPSGRLQTRFKHQLPSQERIANDHVRMFSTNPGMRQVLEMQGVNPYNEKDVFNFFYNGRSKSLYDSLVSSFPDNTANVGSLEKDIKVNPDGSATSKPKPGSGGDEMSESEKKRQARKDRLISEFGLNILKDPTVRDFLFSGGDDYF